jgi:hypothetical protein
MRADVIILAVLLTVMVVTVFVNFRVNASRWVSKIGTNKDGLLAVDPDAATSTGVLNKRHLLTLALLYAC